MAAKFFFKKSNDLDSPSDKSQILDSTNERSSAAFDDSNILESTDDVINETNEFLSDDDDIPLVQLRKPSAVLSSDEDESVTNIRDTPDLDVPHEASNLISDDESDESEEDINNQRRKPTMLSSSDDEVEPWRTPEQSLDEAPDRRLSGNNTYLVFSILV